MQKHDTRKYLLDYSEEKYGKKLVDEIKTLIQIICLFCVQPVYWTLAVQQASNWVFQAEQMDDNLFGLYILKPDQIHAITPLLMIVLIPTFNYIICPRHTIPMSITTKMSIGLLMAIGSFLCATLVERQLELASTTERLNIVWQFPQYFCLALSEFLFALNGYELAYLAAPKNMKSVVQACYLLTIIVGNLLVVFVSYAGMTKFHEHILFTTLMLVNWIAFLVCRRKWIITC